MYTNSKDYFEYSILKRTQSCYYITTGEPCRSDFR